MKETKKLVELEFNETLVLRLIELDEDLCAIFREDFKVPFNILQRLIKDGQLPSDVKATLIEIFDKVIVTNSTLISKYLKLANDSGETVSIKNLKNSEAISEPKPKALKTVLETISETPEENSKPFFKGEIKDVKTPKKDKKLPRRYGKVMILKDIEKQGGKPTPVQNAMLKVNELKNLYVTLSNRGISDMVGETNLLSDADCRDIVAVVTIAKRKLEEIIKRKK